jgi:hypothetical protein
VATFDFGITIDDREYRRMVAAGSRVHIAAGVSAMNKAAGKVRTRAIRSISGIVKLPVTTIRRKTFLRRATFRRPDVRITVYTRPVNPAAVPGVRDTGRGGWKNRKGSGVILRGRIWPKAFLGTTKGGFRRGLAAIDRLAAEKRFQAAGGGAVLTRSQRRRLQVSAGLAKKGDVVLERQGAERYPLKAQKIRIHPEASILVEEAIRGGAQEAFDKILPRELEFRLQRAAKGVG